MGKQHLRPTKYTHRTNGVAAIAANGWFTLALKTDGTVVAWGDNASKQCLVPTNLVDVTAIAAGDFHAVALKGDSTLVTWGGNAYGQTNIPAGLSEIAAIAAGDYHTLALKRNGTLVAWGRNEYGQASIPAGLSGVTAIAAAGFHTIAIIGGTVPLQAKASGNEMILSWPAYTTGLILQATANFTPPVTWADVTNAPILLGAQWTVTNTYSGTAQFFRLWKP